MPVEHCIGNPPGDIWEMEVEGPFYKYGLMVYFYMKIPLRTPHIDSLTFRMLEIPNMLFMAMMGITLMAVSYELSWPMVTGGNIPSMIVIVATKMLGRPQWRSLSTL